MRRIVADRWLAIVLVCFQVGCVSSRLTDTMEKDSAFWAMIERVKRSDQSSHADLLTAELARKPLEEILSFQHALEDKVASANVGDLWAAAMLVNAGQCSDDCFLYFRYWLVSQGRDTYEDALRNPDNLANLVRTMSAAQRRNLEFEDFGYVAMRAYEAASGGKSLTKVTRVRPMRDTEPQFDWRQYTDEVLRSRLPKLWEIFGAEKLAHDRRRDAEVDRVLNNLPKFEIPGVGVIEVGTKVVHKNLGLGTVKGLAGGLVVTAVIAFPDGDRSIVILGDVIKQVVK